MVCQVKSSRSLPGVLRAPVAASVGVLLESRIPARLVWVAGDGTPRIAPVWFAWTGTELVMSTFAGSRKTADLTDGTVVSVSIDTETFPYRSLSLRGPIVVSQTEGLADEYRDAATRYLGPLMAERWLDFVGSPDQIVIALHPTVAIASDMAAESSFFDA